MNTKYVPAMIMLSAGLISCIFGIMNQVTTMEFMTRLLLVLFIFYVIGCIIKIILDRAFNFAKKADEENDAEEVTAGNEVDGMESDELEEISSEDEMDLESDEN